MSLLVKQLQRAVPAVKEVADAKKSLRIEVTSDDVGSAVRKDQTHCAIALACMRGNGVKPMGVIATRSRLYVVDKKGLALRYILPENALREIVSFDRGAQFTPGVYTMAPPSESQTLGGYKGPRTPNPKKKGYTPIHHQVISDIRASIVEM